LVLSIDNPQGSGEVQDLQDAAITVILYNEHTVRANHTFRGQ